MANATTSVKQGLVRWSDVQRRKASSATLGSATRFYQSALLGWTTGGYLAKFDDTQSMILAGVVYPDNGNPSLPAGTAGDGTIDLDYEQPRCIEMTIASIAVTDIGKTVYASDDQTGVLTSASLTYANVVGQVVGKVATNIALVELAYDGIGANTRLNAFRRLAATGAQSLTIFDCGKTIACANSAALALTIPLVADIGFGRGFTIVKDHASDTNAITVTCSGSDSIDGSATLATLDAAWDVVTITATNTNRYVAVSRDIA